MCGTRRRSRHSRLFEAFIVPLWWRWTFPRAASSSCRSIRPLIVELQCEGRPLFLNPNNVSRITVDGTAWAHHRLYLLLFY